MGFAKPHPMGYLGTSITGEQAMQLSKQTSTPKTATLVDRVWPASIEMTALARAFRGTTLAVAGSLLIWLSAKIQVPFFPVPMTMGTLAVLAIGMAYGWRLGAATVLLYLAEGAMGLPVFAGTPEKGIGFAYMMGGTGGYLVGYILAAASVGWLAERGWDKNVLRTALAMLVGNVLIYLPGLLWLGTLFGWDKPILEWGLFPFVLGDLTKLALAAALMPLTWKVLGRPRVG
jgi:biotin transport system substrate-specific component